MITEYALKRLPEEIAVYYSGDYIESTLKPDIVKDSDPSEAPRHYIDVEELANYPFKKLEKNFSEIKKIYGEATLSKAGILPWAIIETFEKLKTAFKNNDREKIMEYTGYLSHYTGDLFQPLHTTSNHDGQLTGNDGIHLRFEDSMIAYNIKSIKLKDYKLELKPLVIESIFDVIRENHRVLSKILDADTYASNLYEIGSREYYNQLFKTTKGIVEERISKAGAFLLELIKLAYNNVK